jgi:predicted nucleic acid-binding protein
MPPDRYVLDASVAAKWYLNDEEYTDEAEVYLLRLLAGEIELHAPRILQYEIGHLLAKAQRRLGRGIDATTAQEAYRTFCALPILYHDLDDAARMNALDFANRHHRGFYDSCYVSLALALGCSWLTSERRYGGQLPPGFPADVVQALETEGVDAT